MSNHRHHVLGVLALLTVLGGGWRPGMQRHVCAQGRNVRLRRVAHPQWHKDDYARIFFDNLFEEALIGSRPASFGRRAAPPVKATAGGGSAAESGGGVYAWSKLISATTIEDEIKSLKLKLDKSITTPTVFAGKGYREARRDFSLLAMLFAIAGEYDGDVRWKKQAPLARDLFARTAANAKVGTSQVYKEAKIRRDDLTDLVGGNSLSGDVGEAAADWSKVCDRAPLMKHLDASQQERLMPWTANAAEFKNKSEKLVHQAELLAAISEVLLKEGMEDADDEDYAAYAKKMKASALEIIGSVKTGDQETASKAVGAIGQACDGCHESYRG